MSRMERNKGARIEREIVDRHRKMGVHAERVPLSGASHYRGGGHDIDIYPRGVDEAPLVAEVKSRASGEGFATIERWLGEYDLLFLRKDRTDPVVVMPWRVWQQLIGGSNAPQARSATHGIGARKPQSGESAEA